VTEKACGQQEKGEAGEEKISKEPSIKDRPKTGTEVGREGLSVHIGHTLGEGEVDENSRHAKKKTTTAREKAMGNKLGLQKYRPFILGFSYRKPGAAQSSIGVRGAFGTS